MKRDCLNGQCRSPVACDGFGYCREVNFIKAGLIQEVQEAKHRYLALEKAKAKLIEALPLQQSRRR